jgi:hypothetical protein
MGARSGFRGKIRDKVRKVGSSQTLFRGRLDPFLDSKHRVDGLFPAQNNLGLAKQALTELG